MHQHKQSIFKFCSIILINCALFLNFLAFSSFYRSLGSNSVSHSPVSKGIKVKRIRTSYLEDAEIWTKADDQNLTHRDLSKPTRKHSEFLADCRLTNCFNFDKCKPGERLKIHIYPDSSKISSSSISSTYQKIIQIIESSIYYEPDESKACLFITRYDYLDRDPLSRDCQKNLPASLPLDYGKNHIVFNLYSGTWPDYRELDLYGFNLGYSILAKASFSYQNYRPGFDISIPLFSKNHPTRGKTWMEPEDGPEYQLVDDVVIETIDTTRLDSSDRKNLLVFKGKRYTHGIGSETRNTLHHLHNDRDILIYTTCKHGKKWKDLKDERCAKDNLEYEKFNYSILMANSTFCLVPRGRRLGSFRFLEALANGCIPVLLSNNWVKPFEDVIDWSEIVVEGDERSLLQLPEIIRSYEWKKIQQMSAKSLAVYETYFSSVERIVYTTIDILNERIQTHLSFTTFLWNLVNPSFTSFTGAIWYDAEYSLDLKDYPGYGKLSDSYSPSRSSPLSSSSATSNSISLPRIEGPINGYTTVLYINKPIMPSTIHRLIKSLSKSQYLVKIIIIWALPGDPPSILMKNPFYDSFLVSVVIPESKSINAKLFPYKDINTYAVLSLQPDTTITVEELDFAYLVWQSFPHRIIGFTARDHYYDEDRYRWYYTSKWTNYYSIILLDAAFYHRYYNNLYTNYISNNKFFAQNFNNWDDELCLDLIFNFLISHLTREGPIKVTQRKRTSNSSSSLYNLNPLNSQECFTFLYNISFNYVPLIKSQMRFDPVLFKDPVSNFRKKYRKLEAVS